MRSSRATRLLGAALVCLIVGTGAPAGMSAAASADLVPAAAAQASAAAAVEAEGRAEPTRLAIKRHGYYHNVSVHNLQWSDWGQASTTARGTFTFQFCVEESCSVSPLYDEPVVVTLSGLKSCGGHLSYATLTLDIEAEMPDSSFRHYRTSLGLGSCRARGSRGR
jgi:hypothetical protein